MDGSTEHTPKFQAIMRRVAVTVAAVVALGPQGWTTWAALQRGTAMTPAEYLTAFAPLLLWTWAFLAPIYVYWRFRVWVHDQRVDEEKRREVFWKGIEEAKAELAQRATTERERLDQYVAAEIAKLRDTDVTRHFAAMEVRMKEIEGKLK